jgi:CSLREA domain-containing protein
MGFTALIALTLVPASLRADTFLVTRFVDKNDGACDRDCSLREAVLAANQHPGFDAILLPPGVYRLSIAGTDEDLGATGDLDVTDDLLILGPGPNETVIDGGGIDRVLDVHAPASVSLNTLAIRHGKTGGTQTSGGGIRNTGYLAINASVVTGNSAPGFGFGGGIYSDGFGSILTLDASTIAGNTAEGGGGGLAVGGRLEVRNSTLSGNRSVTDFGGGAYLFSEAVATFQNATLTANRAAQRGGGIFAEQPLTVPPRFSNTILAANAAPSDSDCLGSPVSGGYNLVGQGEGCPDFQAALGDQAGTAATPLDPGLSRLSDNGGPTPTHALLPGSPAINAGNPAPPGSAAGCLSTDQRFLRRGASRCDIGSFERGAR